MKALGACLALCALLTPGRAAPINGTELRNHQGSCTYRQLYCSGAIGEFCPECDIFGNYRSRQCSPSTGFCWCVDVNTGEEIPNTQRPPGSTPLDCNGKDYCPYKWSPFGRRCFFFVDSPKRWADAEIYCQFEGANLASIHSYEENLFIMSLTRGDTYSFPQSWIGGSDGIQDGFWMWSDGSKFSYTNWHKEVSASSQKESCLKMNYEYDYKWFYDSCTELNPFVCAWRM